MASMKIAINATCLGARASGATQRFKGMYRELFSRLTDTEFVVFEPQDCSIRSWFDTYPNVTFKPTPLSNQQHRIYRVFRGFTFWPTTLKREKCDVFDQSHLPLVKSPSGRTVLQIYDIRYFSQARGLPSKNISRLVLNRAVAGCDRLLTISKSMRDEILSLYPSLDIAVVYCGVDINRFQTISSSDVQRVRNSYKLPADFVLSVGHFERRKNYKNLVTALSLLRDRKRDVHLLIVGNSAGELEEIRRHINSLGVQANITILNGICDFELSCLYRLSKLFVFPSSYEGFGIPILEAMASGCPVVLSDIPVFREITQGQGVYFDHRQPESIANAIDQVLTSSCEHNRLVTYGNTRVMEFTFAKASMALENVYRTLC